MDLVYFFKAVYRRLWIILGMSFLAVVAAFFFLVNKKPYYASIAQYSTGFTAEKVRLVDGTTAIDLYTADVKFDNVIETMKSPEVLSMIAYKLLLHDLTSPEKAYRNLTEKQKQSGIFKLVNVDSARQILARKIYSHELLQTENKTERELAEYLKLYRYDYDEILKALSINRVQRTDYLDIIFRSEDADLSAWVVNAIGIEFLEYYKNLNAKRTNENAQTINEMLEVQQARVDSLNQRLLNEKVSQGAVDPAVRTTGAIETVTELETKLADEKRKYNEHYNRLSYLNRTLKDLQAKVKTGSTNQEVLALTNRKNDLVAALAKKGGSDPDLEKQISELRNEINAKSSSGSGRSKLNEDLDKLNREINEEEALLSASNSTILDYSSRIRKYTDISNQDPGSEIKIDAIRSQLKNENDQLSSLKEKYIQVQGLSKDDPTSNFIQTRVGQPASEPESKKTLLKMALSGLSVFFLTAVFFVFLEVFDSSVKTSAIFNRLAKLKVASSLNRIKLRKRSVIDLVMQDSSVEKRKGEGVFVNNVRQLRHEVLSSQKMVFLITSTKKQAGKTTVVEALAAGLVLSRKKVLVIDLNFQNNMLTQRYTPDVLVQDIDIRMKAGEPVSSPLLVGDTIVDGIHIVGCVAGNVTPYEAFFDLRLEDALAFYLSEFDVILIEGPALNVYAGSKEIVQYVDGIFTVFAADTSITQADHDSMRFVLEQGQKNHGVVLNKVLTENMGS